jgi:hypothetical protein
MHRNPTHSFPMHRSDTFCWLSCHQYRKVRRTGKEKCYYEAKISAHQEDRFFFLRPKSRETVSTTAHSPMKIVTSINRDLFCIPWKDDSLSLTFCSRTLLITRLMPRSRFVSLGLPVLPVVVRPKISSFRCQPSFRVHSSLTPTSSTGFSSITSRMSFSSSSVRSGAIVLEQMEMLASGAHQTNEHCTIWITENWDSEVRTTR